MSRHGCVWPIKVKNNVLQGYFATVAIHYILQQQPVMKHPAIRAGYMTGTNYKRVLQQKIIFMNQNHYVIQEKPATKGTATSATTTRCYIHQHDKTPACYNINMLRHQHLITFLFYQILFITSAKWRLCFPSCLFVCLFIYLCFFFCLSVLGITYQVPSNEQFCIKLLPEVCLGPKNNRLNYGDDPDYDPDPEFGTIH